YRTEFDRRRRDLYPPFTMLTRLLVSAPDETVAEHVSAQLLELTENYLKQNPQMRRRILFLRRDEAPLKLLRGRNRAQVLIKLLEHPDSRQVLNFLQDLAAREWPCDVLL
ncbi:MAG: hypothetical protein MJ136_08245, partial [Clostridia bacterium]|nr:hypothetical protein [Clostridia bacterium]